MSSCTDINSVGTALFHRGNLRDVLAMVHSVLQCCNAYGPSECRYIADGRSFRMSAEEFGAFVGQSYGAYSTNAIRITDGVSEDH